MAPDSNDGSVACEAYLRPPTSPIAAPARRRRFVSVCRYFAIVAMFPWPSAARAVSRSVERTSAVPTLCLISCSSSPSCYGSASLNAACSAFVAFAQRCRRRFALCKIQSSSVENLEIRDAHVEFDRLMAADQRSAYAVYRGGAVQTAFRNVNIGFQPASLGFGDCAEVQGRNLVTGYRAITE